MIGLDAQIACVKREIAMRKNVYPKWVANGRMKQEGADHEIAAMTAVLQMLEAVKRGGSFLAGHLYQLALGEIRDGKEP